MRDTPCISNLIYKVDHGLYYWILSIMKVSHYANFKLDSANSGLKYDGLGPNLLLSANDIQCNMTNINRFDAEEMLGGALQLFESRKAFPVTLT